MDPRTFRFLAEACAGELRAGAPETLVRRVVTDSRQAQAGDLFIPIAGERFDGHSFLGEVAGKGVAAVLVERHRISQAAALPDLVGVIAVDNTRRALGQLAARYRAGFQLPVIAVGGSNGKTTTKELLASVLRQVGRPLWSEASFNNDIG